MRLGWAIAGNRDIKDRRTTEWVLGIPGISVFCVQRTYAPSDGLAFHMVSKNSCECDIHYKHGEVQKSRKKLEPSRVSQSFGGERRTGASRRADTAAANFLDSDPARLVAARSVRIPRPRYCASR